MGAESAATVTGSRFDKLQNNITCASDDLMFIVDADFPVNGNQRFTITKNITQTTNNAYYRIYRTGVNASYVTGMFTIQNDGSLMITGSDTHTLRLDGNKSAVSGGSFDLAVAVQDAMEAKLKAAGVGGEHPGPPPVPGPS